MGRMLEVLRQERARIEPAQETPCPVAARPVEEPTQAPSDEEIPFIEVGTGAKGVEASRAVQAFMNRALPLSPSPTIARTLQVHPAHQVMAGPKAREGTAARKVLYQPLAEYTAGSAIAWWKTLTENNSPRHDEFAALFGELAAIRSLGSPETWLFTSLAADRIAGTVILHLAVAAAQASQKEVLVLDTNAPMLSTRLGLAVSRGLADFLRGEASFDDILLDTGYPRIKAITTGTPGKTTLRAPLGVALTQFLDQVRRRFAWSFLEASHWKSTAGPTLLASFCDAVFLVVNAEDEHRQEVSKLAERIREQGIFLKGSIVIQDDEGRAREEK